MPSKLNKILKNILEPTKIKKIIIFINILLLISFIFITYLTNIKDNIFSNIWFLDIFSHFTLQILYTILGFYILLLIYLLFNYIKNLELLKKEDSIESIYIKKSNILDIVIYIFLIGNILYYISGVIPYPNSNHTIIIKDNNNFMFYQNIERRTKTNEINEIYNQIQKNDVKYISIVENSYEFNNFLLKKEWIKISGNKNTECAIYSKEKNNSGKIIDTKSGYKICYALIENKDIFIVHPHPPKSKKQFDRWNSFMIELNNIRNNIINKQFLIIGDFNDTIYNIKFKTLFNDIYNYSYYSRHDKNKLSWLLTLPIDHVLSNYKQRFYTLKYNKSDHRALIIK